MTQYKPHIIPLQFFNTKTRKKEYFKPIDESLVTLYTCGPTVYNYAHIGNFRCYIFEDLLRRTIKFFGYKLKQVMNITDVDDKTIKGALEQNKTLSEFTSYYLNAFFQDIETLNIEKVELYPNATDYIPEMIELIEKLLEKKVAYIGKDKSVYFAIDRFPNYGCLSHLNLDELKTGASERVEADEYDKENVSDFVVWKAYDEKRDGSIYWDSPFGKGRPGWHMECSAMAMKLLGDTIDLHCGGVDNMFPHHENEIAQSEACTGKRFVNTWLHAEHLIVEGKKMSKSLGNFFTLRDLLEKGYTGRQVRYLLLQTHYKTQLNFTTQGLDAAGHTLQRLDDFVLRMQSIQVDGKTESCAKFLHDALYAFSVALADDLNISSALAALFDLVREVNALADQGKVLNEDAEDVLSLLKTINQVLGVIEFEQADEKIPDDLVQALNKRIEARDSKDWSEADRLRDYILSKGYVIEDTSSGPRLKKAEVSHG